MNAQTLSESAGPAAVGKAWTLDRLTLKNRVLLAPLSGISDVPFRRLARRFGAGLVVSEMIASGEFVKGDAEALKRAMRDGDGPHAVQLAGRDPAWMRAAAERLAAEGADLIDINFGCPAKKVVGGLSGSALMREPDLALRLVEATLAGAGNVPVSVKMRLGWDRQSLNAPQIARRAEEAGVAMITVHGRTRADFYEGTADWKAIAAVKAVVSVPLIANGDLVRPEQLPRMLRESAADAVMIGRGSQGRPWLPGLVAGAVQEADLRSMSLADLVTEHYEAMLSHYGVQTGLRHARKHLGWYLDRFAAAVGPVPGEERAAVMTGRSPDAVIALLRSLFGNARLSDVEPSFADAPLAEAA
ncbi:tRNA dihydrouridine synthase DusB [Jiella sp. M17.18]|uniref:tRNA dihydrouridine synthase DusB n=1 Tax=Jiella sp. M17.18 TaxID=3234247 RepID=UPI0034DFAB0F